eukprot:341811-Chlamydomonas_euryale.AAC.1
MPCMVKCGCGWVWGSKNVLKCEERGSARRWRRGVGLRVDKRVALRAGCGGASSDPPPTPRSPGAATPAQRFPKAWRRTSPLFSFQPCPSLSPQGLANLRGGKTSAPPPSHAWASYQSLSFLPSHGGKQPER